MESLAYDTGTRIRFSRLALACSLPALLFTAYFCANVAAQFWNLRVPITNQVLLAIILLPQLFFAVTIFASSLLFCGVLPDNSSARHRTRRRICMTAASLFALLSIAAGTLMFLRLRYNFSPGIHAPASHTYANAASLADFAATLFLILLYGAAALFLRHIARLSNSRKIELFAVWAMAIASLLTLVNALILVQPMLTDIIPALAALNRSRVLQSWVYPSLYGLLTIYWLIFTVWALRQAKAL